MLLSALRRMFYSLYVADKSSELLWISNCLQFSSIFKCLQLRCRLPEIWEFPTIKRGFMYTVTSFVCVRFGYAQLSSTCAFLTSLKGAHASTARSLCTWWGCPSRGWGVVSHSVGFFLRPSSESVVHVVQGLQSVAPPAPLPLHTGTTTVCNHQSTFYIEQRFHVSRSVDWGITCLLRKPTLHTCVHKNSHGNKK